MRALLFRLLPYPLNLYFFSEIDAILPLCLMSVKNKILIDVGAHYGEWSLPFLKHGWKVFGFEPDPINLVALRKRLCSFKNYSISSNAVLNVSRRALPFYRSSESSGISCLYPFKHSFFEINKVDSVTLSHFLEKNKISKVGVLKIDAEGCDLLVLKGFPWMQPNPSIIVTEYEDKKTKVLNYDMRDLADFLINKDYHLFISQWEPIRTYGGMHKWKSMELYSPHKRYAKGWGNFLAFSKDYFDDVHFLNKSFVGNLK